MSEITKGELTFELSAEPQKHCNYGDLILGGKIFARDIHRDHAIDIMRCWNGWSELEKQRDDLLAALENKQEEIKKLTKQRDNLRKTCEIMLQEIEDNNYARYGINPGADDESDGAKLGRATILGRAAIAKAEKED